MATPKSPFKVYRQFLSPKLCEHFCDKVGFTDADVDADNNPVRMFKHNAEFEEIVFNRLQLIVPELEEYYGLEYKGTEEIMIEWYSNGVIGKPQCENSHYLKKKWVRTSSRDLSCVLFMSDYNENADFDTDYEVYGGKLEFPQHGFGFNPERGTMIVYPSCPHFINATATIQAGELYQARIHIAATYPYLYDPTEFPGDYRNWFQDLV